MSTKCTVKSESLRSSRIRLHQISTVGLHLQTLAQKNTFYPSSECFSLVQTGSGCIVVPARILQLMCEGTWTLVGESMWEVRRRRGDRIRERTMFISKLAHLRTVF